MCGIVAVLGQPTGAAPPAGEVLAALERALGALRDPGPPGRAPAGASTAGSTPEATAAPDATADTWIAALDACARSLDDLDQGLRTRDGVRLLVASEELCAGVEALVTGIDERLRELETALDGGAVVVGAGDLERLNAALVSARDALWAVACDRIGLARRVRELAGGAGDSALVDGFTAAERVLSALDRLEVRGRDSAGVHLLLGSDGDPDPIELDREASARVADPLFASGALRLLDSGRVSVVYKAAAEIGELGDNGRRLRRALGQDALLRRALARAGGEVAVLGHTRWASVGIISEANAHPLNQEEEGRDGLPYVVAVLNGDVDNYVDLRDAEGLRIADSITTDAKIIPMLVARRLAEGLTLVEAFRRTVASFSGSVAIAAQSASEPDLLLLALCGSGQALYVGLAAGMFVVASEPYGLVEQTSTYLRMDGETPGNPDNPTASRGQIVVLDRRRAGSLEGIRRLAYDGTDLPVRGAELLRAEVTTRDIHRGDHPHFLLKEIRQAPESFRKTLRGKIWSLEAGAGGGRPAGIGAGREQGRLRVRLADETLPAELRSRLRSGAIRRVIVIGQGTAAVAGQAVADAIAHVLPEDRVTVRAMPATELSGFHLRPDMRDTLIVAISQSGTTTDTNRTVDLARGRGATVVAVVNRRGSDLVSKADGILFTSDGRDIEMSVASTKAFYSQIAAGFLLALALGQAVTGDELDEEGERLLEGLRELPAAMETVLAGRAAIAEAASRLAPKRRYWAVVGNGINRVAAAEIRIKLSELCYKSIACDATEDKKHIDLSSEPLILVCAAALQGSTLADVAKEVAIYRAHKAAPVVIATAGAAGFEGVEAVLEVPPCHPRLAFVLATMVGHLFGYEAAIAIDRLALPLRELRGEIERLVQAARPGENLLDTLRPRAAAATRRFLAGLADGRYDGQLEASTAVRLTSLVRFVSGTTPLESYAAEHGRSGTPGAVIEDLTLALTRAIEELTRPVDAIKHQAKTVTVGISRTDEALLVVPLVRAALQSGVARDLLTYRDLRALAGLDAAVEAVRGFTRYRILQGENGEPGWIGVAAQEGIARDIPSRTSDNHELRGTKHQVVRERQLLVARGRSDGRTVIFIPEIDKTSVVGLLLLHVRFHDFATPAAMRGVLDAYRTRYTTLRDAVMETEPEFDEEILGRVPVADLLTFPIHDLAAFWQTREKVRVGDVVR
ncbi:MAG TPA: SIS domain-containing protein [Thermoanaerobaculia bacterium]|nr:SIS domain-containing protein [Thermoanaerobaculia bacterium]